MVQYNKSALQAYSQANVIGVDEKSLSNKILKSILFYIDNSISTFDKDNENTVECYQSLNNANRLLIDLVENLSIRDEEERNIVLTILQKVEYDVLSAMKDDYSQLRESKKGLETIIDVMNS